MELLDVYDDSGKINGRTVHRGAKDDEFNMNEHIAISVIFIENNEGKFLIQKVAKKDNMYSSTGGHVSKGETPLMAIIRETKEEIGVDISNEKIIDLGKVNYRLPIRFGFYLKKDFKINDCILDKNEVESVQYMSIKEIQRLYQKNMFTESHKLIFNKLLEYKNIKNDNLTEKKLLKTNLCPVCYDRGNNNCIYGKNYIEILYENDDFEVFLYKYLKNTNYIVIRSKRHFNSYLDVNSLLKDKMFKFAKFVSNSMKYIYGYKKIYKYILYDKIIKHYTIYLIPKYKKISDINSKVKIEKLKSILK